MCHWTLLFYCDWLGVKGAGIGDTNTVMKRCLYEIEVSLRSIQI